MMPSSISTLASVSKRPTHLKPCFSIRKCKTSTSKTCGLVLACSKSLVLSSWESWGSVKYSIRLDRMRLLFTVDDDDPSEEDPVDDEDILFVLDLIALQPDQFKLCSAYRVKKRQEKGIGTRLIYLNQHYFLLCEPM